MIADAFRAVALAGIMGGYDTMITEQTRNVLIESAWFDPATIRYTSRRLGMHTDASHRFERGADFGQTPLACARVAELVQQTAGCPSDANSPSAMPTVEAEIDALARRVERPQIHLRQREVQRILGVDIPGHEISRILQPAGLQGDAGNSCGRFRCHVPVTSEFCWRCVARRRPKRVPSSWSRCRPGGSTSTVRST